jgi:hypothetical protein
MDRRLSRFFIFIFISYFFLSFLFAQEAREKIHKRTADTLPASCLSCHKRYVRGEPWATAGEERFCYLCHGGEEKRGKSKNTGRLSYKVSLIDISAEFSKSSHHPVELRRIHWRGEILPEVNPRIPRHSECADCHEPHRSYKKINIEKGKKKPGNNPGLKFEYELCYKCHSNSANLPSGRTNKAIEFQPTNPSYHPVESEGKNLNVPSLLPPLKAEKSILNCTDCHNNDDPKGPSGPHGSIYSPILVKNYTTQDGYLEDEFIYALCYECHSRRSILNNESFPYHSLHISEKKNSCYSCHNSHGSAENTHLIEFRLDRAQADSVGRFEFIDRGEFKGECYLKCHPAEKGGIEHSPKSY